MSLFDRVLTKVENNRERLLSGKLNSISTGFKRFEEDFPGIEQGKNTLITANSKVGKTQIMDFIYLYNIITKILDEGLNIKVKIFYFTLEMTAEQKMLQAFAHFLYKKEGIIVDTKELRSVREILDENVLNLIKKYENYFRKIEEIVTFIDDARTPYSQYVIMRDYAESHGKIHKKKVEIKPGEFIELEDYYEAYDSDEYVIGIWDHIGLLQPMKDFDTGLQLDLFQTIGKLTSYYMIRLRNRFNYCCIAVQQQMAGQESVENKKYNKLKPSLDGLATNKETQRDFDYILGLFSPFRHEIPEYLGYDVKWFKDNLRFLEILGGREGGGGIVSPLYFNGAVNDFKELPLPSNTQAMKEVYRQIDKIRNS